MKPAKCDLITQESLEEGFYFPSFSSFDTFENSDFFRKYYFLGSRNLQKSGREAYIKSLYGTFSQERLIVGNLQRMLVVLGYFDIQNLGGKLQEIEKDFCSVQDNACSQYDPYLYYGIFGEKTDGAVRAFQRDHFLNSDGMVGPKTRQKLYQEIYHRVHEEKNTTRENVFTATREELFRMCHQ